MTHPATGAAQYDSAYVSEQAFKELKVSSRIYAPFFSNHMKLISNGYSINKWADNAKPASIAYLDGAYTAGSGQMKLKIHTLVNDYRKNVISGVTEVQTANGGARYKAGTFDPDTRILTVTFEGGTDVNLSDGDQINFLRVNGQNDKPNANNDASVFGGGDYNYWSHFNYHFEISDDMKNGKIITDINEFSMDHQIDMNMDDAYFNFEFKCFHDPRIAGTGAKARIPDGSNQGGYRSRAGGILTLGRARGMYEVDSDYAPLSLNMLRNDTRQLRTNHAFAKKNSLTRETGVTVVKAYCDKTLYPEVSKLAEITGSSEALYSVSEKIDGVLGVSCHKILVDDVIYAFEETDGLGNRSIFYETHPEDIDINVMHFMNITELAKMAPTTRQMAENAFTVEMGCPWRFGFRTKVGTI
jgi:hypothetical protein